MHQNNYVVIMAGGVGSRFWPMSRTTFPKQFHDILGTGRTLLQQTADRFAGVCPPENIYIVTNRDYASLVAEQLPHLNEHQILLEPLGRNTAPCVAYACMKIVAQNPDANIVVAPSDHIILKEEEFERKILQGLAFTEGRDVLLTLGIKPSRPDTGYGYIQYLPGSEDVRKVKTFTEKPHLDLAKAFLESGDFVWNAGIFLWNGQSIINALKKHMPEMHEIFEEGRESFFTDAERNFINTAYGQCKNISIDYGIMEKSDNVYTLLCDVGWSDLGTWKSLYELSQHNEEGNVVSGNVMLYDTRNCIIKSTSNDKLIVVEGLENYIVAESNDVIMICRLDQEQKVRDFVADTKANQPKRFV